MSDPNDFDERYARIRENYVGRVRDRMATIERAVEALREEFEVERFDEIRQLVHRLAGSGETMGFPDISARSIELEEQLDAIDPASEEAWLTEVEDYCREIRDLVADD